MNRHQRRALTDLATAGVIDTNDRHHDPAVLDRLVSRGYAIRYPTHYAPTAAGLETAAHLREDPR